MKDSTIKNKLASGISILMLLSIWKGMSLFIGSDLLLPPPEKVAFVLADIMTEEKFARTLGYTLLRGLVGFGLSLILGIIVGLAAGTNRIVDTLTRPFLVVIRSTPVIAIILLAIIWFKTDMVPVFTGFLMMFPIICTNVIDGIKSVENELVEMAGSYQVRTTTLIRDIYLPALAPFIVGGISTAMGIGWRAIIATEVLSQPQFAIGTRMHTAQVYLQVPEVLAWTVVAVFLSYLFETLVRFVEKKSIVWR